MRTASTALSSRKFPFLFQHGIKMDSAPCLALTSRTHSHADDQKRMGTGLASTFPSTVTTSLSSFPSATLLNLTGHIAREDEYYSAHGGSADIWKGIWLKDTGNCMVWLRFHFIPLHRCPRLTSHKVAIKVVRANIENENGHEKMNKARRQLETAPMAAHSSTQRLRKEILVWHKLDHKNILPLLGVTFDFGCGTPAILWVWSVRG
jgi:hypothetical protein